MNLLLKARVQSGFGSESGSFLTDPDFFPAQTFCILINESSRRRTGSKAGAPFDGFVAGDL